MTRAWLSLLMVVAGAQASFAQTPAATSRKPEIDVSMIAIAGASAGSQNANLTAPDGSPFLLFSSSQRVGPAFGPEVQVGFGLTRHLSAEVTGSWTHAELRSSLSADFEGAAPVTATERLSMFTLSGSGVWSFARRGKWQPFLRGGAGWLRELTSDSAVAADGAIAHGGGGVKYWWRDRPRGAFKRFGVRTEARFVSRHDGLSFGNGRRLNAIAGTVGVMIGF